METKTPNTIIILSLVLIFFCSCHHNPNVVTHTIHDTVYKFIPHRAPDSAYLGRYEEMKGPFMMPRSPGSKDSVLIEERQWRIDSGLHNYITTARGYLHQRGRDGRVIDIPITIEDSNHYDTLRTHFSSPRHLPVAKPPVSNKLPDSVHLPTKKDEQKERSLWKKLRSVHLPYTYLANSNMELTIRGRKVSTETIHDTIYLKTKLSCIARFLDGELPTQPITMEETEPVE